MKRNNSKYDIFISYRRENGADTAKHLRDILVSKGYSVFFDTDSLQSGDFNRALLDVIENCTDFIIILSPNALDRCVNEKDWVRQELACALRTGKNVIPVTHRNFHFPEELPEDINDVRWKNGIAVNIEYFDAMVNKLIMFLHSKPRLEKRKIIIPAVICLLAVAALIFMLPKLNTGKKPVTAPETVQEVSVTNEPVQTVAPTQTVAPVQTAIPVNTPEPVTEAARESSEPDNTLPDSAQANSSSSGTAANETAVKNPAESSLWNYEIVGDHVEITGYTGTETDLVIPEELEGLPVTALCPVNTRASNIGILSSGFPSSLRSLTIPGTVELIDSMTFYRCTNLTRVVLSDGIKEIKNTAFSTCTNLSEINFPDSITYIGSGAFWGCEKLRTVTLPASVRIENNPFSDCTGLREFIVTDSAGGSLLSAKDGVLFDGSQTTLLCYPAGKTDKAYVLPETVRNITWQAFYGAMYLRSVTLPADMSAVDPHAFDGCTGLEKVELPEFLQTIGYYAFSDCKWLKSISIPETVARIETGAFKNCDGMTSVYLPSNIAMIEKYAFDGCSSLKDIYFSGTEEEWQDLHIDEKNEVLSTAAVHYNSQG